MNQGQGRMLDPDLREVARQLVATGSIRAEVDPEPYRIAVKGRKELAEFFRAELGWTLEVLEVAEFVRLHKRRVDVPGDRGPWLQRADGERRLAPAKVLVLTALVCEQLWRRPRMSLRELLQAIAQVCAAEAPSGRLPSFRIVAADGISKKEAQDNRRCLVAALKLLAAEGWVAVDADLDRAVTDESSDLVVSASRTRLAAKFSSLPPTLLELDKLPPGRHLAALSAESLLDHTPMTPEPAVPTVDDRRLMAVRRLVDDPATDPVDDAAGTPYLHTLTGRERALTLVASLGLVATVRRDWWEITDPTGLGSGINFPAGRRIEWQAALALLALLTRRDDPPAPLPIAEAIELFERVRDDLPRWAAAYQRLTGLVRAAAAELVHVGLLTVDPEQPDRWHPTPGVHLWRIQVRQAPARSTPSGSGRRPHHPPSDPDAAPRAPDSDLDGAPAGASPESADTTAHQAADPQTSPLGADERSDEPRTEP